MFMSLGTLFSAVLLQLPWDLYNNTRKYMVEHLVKTTYLAYSQSWVSYTLKACSDYVKHSRYELVQFTVFYAYEVKQNMRITKVLFRLKIVDKCPAFGQRLWPSW